MTNPKRGECLITLADKEYNTKLNLDSIMRIETACQKSFLRVATELGDANFQMQHIVFILQTALKGGGNDIKDAAVKALIWDAGITEAVTAVGEIITAALLGGEDKEEGNELEAELS